MTHKQVCHCEQSAAISLPNRKSSRAMRGLPATLAGNDVGSLVTGTLYNNLGQITQVDLGNGASTSYEYWGIDHTETGLPANSQFGKLWQITTQDADNSAIQQVQHSWDPGGNLVNREDIITGDLETFSYDPLDRLEIVTATGGSGGELESYGKIYRYSPIGNILEMNGKTYSYDSERPHAVTGGGTATYEYDANGNMTWRGSENQSITWNEENMPSTISGPTGTATFVYDGDGKLVIKTENNQTILYVNQYFEKNLTTGEETSYYYLGGRRIAFKKGDDLEYTHNDHLTSTSVTTDSNGNEMATVKYFPFGEARTDLSNVHTDKLFTGQRLDETCLYYYNARYYDANIGRFISPDSIVPEPFNPQSLNRYSYCLNNPLKYVDPSGNLNIFNPFEVANFFITTMNFVNSLVSGSGETSDGYSGGGSVEGGSSPPDPSPINPDISTSKQTTPKMIEPYSASGSTYVNELAKPEMVFIQVTDENLGLTKGTLVSEYDPRVIEYESKINALIDLMQPMEKLECRTTFQKYESEWDIMIDVNAQVLADVGNAANEFRKGLHHVMDPGEFSTTFVYCAGGLGFFVAPEVVGVAFLAYVVSSGFD